MKYLLFLFSTLLFFGFSYNSDRPDDFQYKLNDIISNFKKEIMNKEDCQNLSGSADYLAREINDALKNEYEYSHDEKNQLIRLKRDAEALYQYIRVVSNNNTTGISINDFNLANEIVGGIVKYIVQDKFCLDEISVTISNYVAFLAVNNTAQGYFIKIKWKTANGKYSGSLDSGINKNSMTCVTTNRNEPELKKIFFYSVTCKIPSQ